MLSFNFNLADIDTIVRESTRELQKWVEIGVKQWSKVLLSEVNRLTPEDSWKLLRWNKETFKKEKSVVTASIINKTSYAQIVEDWVWKTYNYHKSKSVIHKWKWNKWFERALEKKTDEILKIVSKSI